MNNLKMNKMDEENTFRYVLLIKYYKKLHCLSSSIFIDVTNKTDLQSQVNKVYSYSI